MQVKRPASRGPSHVEVESVEVKASEVKALPIVQHPTTQKSCFPSSHIKHRLGAFINSLPVQTFSILCVLLTLFLSDAVAATTRTNSRQGADLLWL